MSANDDELIADSLASIASTEFEMGHDLEQAEAAVLRAWESFGRPDLQSAADALRRLPQPLLESAEETARREPARAMLGVTSAERQLEAALAARELLERLARERQ